MATDYDAIFKAYDIRGTVGDQIDADGVRAIGGAFARFVARLVHKRCWSGGTCAPKAKNSRPHSATAR